MIRREPALGLKSLLLPVSYWRAAEFAYASRHLSCPPGSRVLDLGSPNRIALFLARNRGYEIVATDIRAEEVELTARCASAQGLTGNGPGLIATEVQDGRSLGYPDGSFDAAYSVSVLEHIPNDGDTLAIRELVRVVKPGGRIVVTVPYDRTYRETFLQSSVYERQQVGSEPVFFQRHYDDETLDRKLIKAAGAELIDLEIWGESSLRVERLLGKLRPVSLALSPLEALLSGVFLRRIDSDARGHPMAAFLTLRRAG